MRTFSHWMLTGTVVLAVVAAGDLGLQARQQPGQAVPAVTPDGPGGTAFNGTWIYNAEESVDAMTGRPETGPVRPGQRRGGPTTPTGRTGTTGRAGGGTGGTGGTGGMGGGGFGGGGGGFGGGGAVPPSGMIRLNVSEERALVRDLLEVPWEMTITVTPDEVAFLDDLDRELRFPTDDKKHRYQISASPFEARAHWDGVQFRKFIEGVRGFRMNETYFLSADGKRLFVIIRVGEPKPNEPIVGVNRVYDRADQRSTRR